LRAQAKSKFVWNKNCIQFDFSWTFNSVQYSRISKPTFHAISSSLVSSHPLSFSDLMDSFSQERSWVLEGQSLSLIVTPYPLGAFFRSLGSSYFHSISVNKLEYEKRYWPVILARVGRTGPQILSHVVGYIISPCNHIKCFIFWLIRFLISVF